MNTIQTNITVSEYGIFTAKFSQGQIPPGKYSLLLTVHEPPSDDPPQSERKTVGVIRGEITPPFAQLLEDYMERIGAGANTIVEGIKKILAKQAISAEKVKKSITRETVNRWRGGKKEKLEPVMPHKDNCHLVLPAIAQFLRLTERETNCFLKSAGCAEVYYLDLPDTLFQQHIAELFNKLSRLDVPVMMLLTQAGWGEPPLLKALLAQAKIKYSPDNVLHLQPPYSSSANTKECFLDFGKQCGFDNVDSESALGHKLETRLKNTRQSLFLLLTRFEQYDESVQQQLGGMFNRLKDSDYSDSLHVILCGGEALGNLKYNKGIISFLNHAKDERWPELGLSEVKALAKYRFDDLQLDDEPAKELLRISGGHPQLLSECLARQQQKPGLPLEAYPDELSKCPQARGHFIALAKDDNARQEVSKLLKNEDLGKFSLPIQGYWHDKLYWRNLVAVRKIDGETHLYWRCDALRKAGADVFLETENQPQRGDDDEKE